MVNTPDSIKSDGSSHWIKVPKDIDPQHARVIDARTHWAAPREPTLSMILAAESFSYVPSIYRAMRDAAEGT